MLQFGVWLVGSSPFWGSSHWSIAVFMMMREGLRKLFAFDKKGPNGLQYGVASAFLLGYFYVRLSEEASFLEEEERLKSELNVPHHPAYKQGTSDNSEEQKQRTEEEERAGVRRKPWASLFRSSDYYLTGNMRHQVLDSDQEMEQRLRRELGNTTYNIWKAEGFIPERKSPSTESTS
eukprot:GHVS01018746.1.p1 GENE.GHVS01018746.1~~GHVS01018746.1.p1  ORF type:complete len:177 (-),score=27.24 GHVS01018746.1:803-1333(-)